MLHTARQVAVVSSSEDFFGQMNLKEKMMSGFSFLFITLMKEI